MVMHYRPRRPGELGFFERPSDYPTKYCITDSGERRLLKLSDIIAARITPENVRTIQTRILRDLQNEQYMLATLSSYPPLTREELIYGGQETAMLSSFNELLRSGWVEQV